MDDQVFLNMRLSRAEKEGIEALAKRMSEQHNRKVTLKEVLLLGYQYGLPFVERDINIGIDIPRVSRVEQLTSVAAQIFQKGLEQIMPGEAA